MKSPSRPYLWLLFSLPFIMMAWRITASLQPPPIAPAQSKKLLEAAPMCPWRQPQQDMRKFFPGATHYRSETLILTGKLREIKARLGRLPAPEENPLYLHRIYRHKQTVGVVLVRRVKGEYGSIEIVLAVKQNGSVLGLNIQRMREPQAIAGEIDSPIWQRSFRGKTSRNVWRIGQDVPAVAPIARASAQAIIEGARSLVVLHEVGKS